MATVPEAPEGKKWVLVPEDAYGYRAPGWHNQMENMPESAVSGYESFHLYIIDDVPRGPGVDTGAGTTNMVQHEYLCNEIANLFTTTFTDCNVHSVRMEAGQREEDFVEYFEDELEQYGPNDLIAFYFHGKTGEKGKNYTWRFRGPGPKHINAYDFINQVNASKADCYFILDCFIPTNFPKKRWERKDHMTEFSVASHQMRNDNGRPINGPQNFTETLCRSVRRFVKNPGKKNLPSLHHIMGRDRKKVSHPLRLWTNCPDRTKKHQQVWRFCLDVNRFKQTGRLEMRRCKVTGRRSGDGEFGDVEDEDGDRDDGERGGLGSGLRAILNNGNDDDEGDDEEQDPRLKSGDDDVNDDDGANDHENETDRLRKISHQLQAGRKRKRDDHQESSSTFSKVPKRSPVVTPGHRSDSPIALDDDEGEGSLFVSQNRDPSSVDNNFESTALEETTPVKSNAIDHEVVDLVEDNITVAMNTRAESGVPRPGKGKQPVLPRLGGLFTIKPRNNAQNSIQLADKPNTPDWVAQLPTSARDATSQAPEDRLSRSIKQSDSPSPRAGGGSRFGSVGSAKRERVSTSFRNGATSRLGSVNRVKRELPDDDDVVITGFSAKVILPTANGDTVDLTLDD